MFLLSFLFKIWVAFRAIFSFLIRAYTRSRASSSAGSKADGIEKTRMGDIHIASDVSSTTLATLNGSFEEANLEAGHMTPPPKPIGLFYYLPHPLLLSLTAGSCTCIDPDSPTGTLIGTPPPMTGKQSSRSGTYFGKNFFYHSDGQPDSPGSDEAIAAEGMFYPSYIPISQS